MLAIALRNRDRATLLWPLVHDYLALIMGAEGSKPGNGLVTRAALGLLRCGSPKNLCHGLCAMICQE